MQRSVTAFVIAALFSLVVGPATAGPGAVTISVGGHFVTGDHDPYRVNAGPHGIDTAVIPLIQRAGDDLLFLNRDIEGHNITSVDRDEQGVRLFASDTIDRTQVAVVTTSHLPAGDYGFFCSIHPFMTATLTVV